MTTFVFPQCWQKCPRELRVLRVSVKTRLSIVKYFPAFIDKHIRMGKGIIGSSLFSSCVSDGDGLSIVVRITIFQQAFIWWLRIWRSRTTSQVASMACPVPLNSGQGTMSSTLACQESAKMSEGNPSMCTYWLPYANPTPDNPGLTSNLSISLNELPNLLLASFGLALMRRVFFSWGQQLSIQVFLCHCYQDESNRNIS